MPLRRFLKLYAANARITYHYHRRDRAVVDTHMKKYIITGFTIIASFTAFSSGGYQQGMFGVRVARAADSAVNVPIGSDTSSNWAGYVASVGTFTSVGAGWTVPRVVGGNGSLSADATWVGIGGLSSNDLIQVGTQAIVQNGTTTYEPWYELLPASAESAPVDDLFVVQRGVQTFRVSLRIRLLNRDYHPMLKR